LNSTCLKGAYIPFHRLFIVVGRDTGGGELVWAEILLSRILNIVACSARTKSPMGKKRLRLDSAR